MYIYKYGLNGTFSSIDGVFVFWMKKSRGMYIF